MNKELSQEQTAWNNGFDYFFEKGAKNSLLNVHGRGNSVQWLKGFMGAANYCEGLLKQEEKKSDI